VGNSELDGDIEGRLIRAGLAAGYYLFDYVIHGS
jgi:hypothetical protein